MNGLGAIRANPTHIDPENEGQVESGRGVGCRSFRGLLVLLGIVLGQLILYGPSLVGQKILLPLDELNLPGVYLPDSPEHPNVKPQDIATLDIVSQIEPDRRFAARELAAGRFPLWQPCQYGGAPFKAPKYSPFFLLSALTASPRVWAWVQLLVALVAGAGMHVFCRRVLRVGFWPAAIVAWGYPLTGFFIFWQGFVLASTVCLLPWLLLAVYHTVQGGRMAAAGLVLATATELVVGQLDVVALVLLGSGLFALWCLWDAYRAPALRRRAGRAVLALTLGWGLGFLLASPSILPVVEYLKTGHRMAERYEGKQERPPVGLAALPQVVLPDIYGSSATGSYPLLGIIGEPNLQESAAAAYAGLLATLVIAPLAWCSRRHRSLNYFLLFLAVFGVGWCLDLPGLVELLSLPGANMLSFNRLVFATAFAVLALAAIGLDVLNQRTFRWQPVCWVPAAWLAGLCAWCLYDAAVLPPQLPAQIEALSKAGFPRLKDATEVQLAQAWFARHYIVSACWCGVGGLMWLALRFCRLKPGILVPAFGVLLLGELWSFSHGRSVQSDPALYYPEIPALRHLAEAAPGRVIGFDCFPANMAEAIGLSDARGYDAVDPDRWVSLLSQARDPRSSGLPYAATQWEIPCMKLSSTNGLQLSPILDLLGVRYVIFRGSPLPGTKPVSQSPDYWVLENTNALPRVFIPQRVEVAPDDKERLEKLSLAEFNPREVAYVETPVKLPAACAGSAKIEHEIPTRMLVRAQMKTAGLLVLADLWDVGWSATVNGQPAPILRTDHALRGVVLPPGPAQIEFRYHPASLALAYKLAGAALLGLLVWLWWWPFSNRNDSVHSGTRPAR